MVQKVREVIRLIKVPKGIHTQQKGMTPIKVRRLYR